MSRRARAAISWSAPRAVRQPITCSTGSGSAGERRTTPERCSPPAPQGCAQAGSSVLSSTIATTRRSGAGRPALQLVIDSRMLGGESSQIDHDHVGVAGQPVQRQPPGVVGAHQLVHAIATVPVRCQVEPLEAPLETLGVLDEAVRKPTPDEVQELRVTAQALTQPMQAGDDAPRSYDPSTSRSRAANSSGLPGLPVLAAGEADVIAGEDDQLTAALRGDRLAVHARRASRPTPHRRRGRRGRGQRGARPDRVPRPGW